MLRFIEKALAAQPKPKKTGLSVVSVKKLMAVVEKTGKQVATIKAAPDGSVTVSIGSPSSAGTSISDSDWDGDLE